MNTRLVGGNAPRAQLSFRISKLADRFVETIRLPGFLTPEGCSKGDVIETAIRRLAVKKGLLSPKEV
jgi:hypothetical protein